ncbi:5-formyltetrahydrofolate cyclo-ligase [Shewanella sedimentimangrovi]|uniref:5-formyltetrahydrofolate cyclo-ligase n=1 Tax=Shewanella sedimentimangrovi TaxID=2814293 RepID=A0ABX7R431_9GAMM|nr:5-formyltetrahydrofolate cyclo-ligase [Shewanella sedimentimangrovi]QSX37945.1 5-formyltetrahydrofolate cyclo-ligase [Shewanella sedimentimangrovi]
MTMSVIARARSAIRKDIRSHRKALTPDEQHTASRAAASHVLDCLPHAQRVALYLENDGELGTRPLIEALWAKGCETYLPVLHPFAEGHLLFIHYEADTQMTANVYGIPEPKLSVQRLCPANQLDAIITPLVAFDSTGNRLGMGGGFYDRTLANLPDRVKVIGLAHDCQRLPALPVEAWDVPLPMIVTPSKVYRFGSEPAQ